MPDKPSSSDGYGFEQLQGVHRTCLYLAARLGDLLDEIVVVGGLVPNLLVDQKNLPAGLRPDTYVDDALSVIERDFRRHDGPGPVGTARFITRELDENVQADVVGHAQALLRFMGLL